MEAPNLLESFLESCKLAVKERNIFAIFPWFFLATVCLPPYLIGKVSNIIDLKLDTNKISTATSAFLVAGSFFGTTTINLMGQLYSMLSDSKFSKFLKDADTTEVISFWPQFVAAIQIAFLMLCVASILIYATGPESLVVNRLFVCTVGAFFYALSKLWMLMNLVREVSWHRSDYMTILEDEIANERKAQLKS